jgi:Secretion system C-terminal sorting domain/PKD-like domain
MKKIVQTSMLLFLLLWSINISAQAGGSISGPYQVNCNTVATYSFSAGIRVTCTLIEWTVGFPDGSTANFTGSSISISTGFTEGWITVIANGSNCKNWSGGGSPEYSAGIQTYVGGQLSAPYSLNGPSDLCNSSVGTYTASSVSGAGSYTFFVPSGWKINGQSTTSLTTSSTSVSITAASSGSGTAEIRVRANPFSGAGCLTSSDETTTDVNYGVQWPEIYGSTELGTNSFGNFSYTGFNISNVQWTIPSSWSSSGLNGSYLTVITGSNPGNYVVSVSAQTCGSTVGDFIDVTVTSGGFIFVNPRKDGPIATVPKFTSKIDLGKDVALYPNPVSTELYLHNSNKDINLISVSITNLADGKQVLYKKVNNDYSIIDLSNIMTGSYVVNMITSSGEQIHKKIQVVH